jgi:hypothetical protein
VSNRAERPGYRAPMRTSWLRAVLLPLAVAPAVLAGCSSGDSETPAAAASDADEKETFCAEVPGLLSDVSSDLQGVQAPADAPRVLDEAVTQISAVEPPADAEPQWERLVAAWTGMRDLLGEADLQNPEANTELAPRLQELQAELVDSGSAIDDYGKANC